VLRAMGTARPSAGVDDVAGRAGGPEATEMVGLQRGVI
jgi:hypothetical protein